MPQRVDAVLLHVLSQAASCPDSDIAIGFAIGFPAVGDIAPSGWWQHDSPKDESGKAMPNIPWQRAAEQRARADAGGEEHAQTWRKPLEEVQLNLID